MTLQRRRLVLCGSLGLLAGFACPVLLNAQGRIARIGDLNTAARGSDTRKFLWDALAARGWVEGRNLRIDERYADGDRSRLEPLAAELVAFGPDVIVASTQPAAVAAMKATRTIPIVFVIVPEPVESGLVESLARPGKNATGLATMNKELVGKRLELLRELLPKMQRVALLLEVDFDMNRRQAAFAESAAKLLGLDVLRVGIGLPHTFDASFGDLARQHPDAVLVIENPPTFTHRAEIARRMAEVKIPAMYGFQEFSRAGGLISYSVDFRDQFRRAADYVDRILRGARPGDLPIQQPLKFALTVNLAAAKALGISVPQSLLLRADEVIE